MNKVGKGKCGRHHARRLVAAFAVVAAIVFAPAAIDVALHAVDPQSADARVTNAGGLDAQAIIGGGDAMAVLANLEEAVVADGLEAVPIAFLDEAGLLPGARDVRVSVDGTVVGYLLDLDADEALALLLSQMEAHGWAGVSLGGVDGYTFLKDSGCYTWVLATCTQVGDATSVVMRTG